jgi:hypothetical protein
MLEISEEGIEGAFFDSQPIRSFVGIDLSHALTPDTATLVELRNILEKQHLTEGIFANINALLRPRA